MRLQLILFWGVLGPAACPHALAHGQGDDAVDSRPGPLVSAAGPVPAPVVARQAVPVPAPVPAAERFVRERDDGLSGVSPLPAERLAQWRGGTDTVSNDMRLNGTVAGNAAVNVATGANIITNGSFSNASGLPVAIQNSGANVLIQNATIINVELK